MICMATSRNCGTKEIAIACESARIVSSSFSLQTRFTSMLSRTGRKPMTEAAILEKIERLNLALARLQERVEDLEDLRDLEAAIAENAGKSLIPWQQVKAEDDLDFTSEFEKSIRQAEREMADGKPARVREPEGP